MTSYLPNSVISSQSSPYLSVFSTLFLLTAHIENENICMTHWDKQTRLLEAGGEHPTTLAAQRAAGAKLLSFT